MAAALDMTTALVGFDSPAAHAVLLMPDDSTDLANPARALYVGTAGNIKVTTINGDTVLFTAVPVGILPVAVRRVWSSTTTASTIIGLR